MSVIKLEVVNKSNIVELDMVEKFNPYHDKLGRFTTAGGATVFTWRTKDSSKQWMANRAIEREKERTAMLDQQQQQKPKPKRTTKPKPKKIMPKKREDKEVKDPNKIAGVKRGEPMGRIQANSKNVNPNFFKSNDPGYRTNCQSCVVTYEARLRGYDVTTKPKNKNGLAQVLALGTHRAWLDPKTGEEISPPPRLEVKNAKALKQVVIDTVQKGERYNMSFRWKNRNSGHIVTFEKDAMGMIFMYDPQSGQRFSADGFEAYFKQFQYQKQWNGQMNNVAPRLYRIDNLVINPVFADAIMTPNIK